MKTMTCKQLGGACDMAFHAQTFDEMAELSKQHGIEMFNKNDSAHLAAMQKMQVLMKDPQQMQDWFEARKREFESLPENT
ncbi:hypothetical protein [Glaciecola sp. 1036]|uniref:hypothetical protein n=1 Tax=Alteromonadaceae TaxID=72275 RepID=UPI003D087B17